MMGRERIAAAASSRGERVVGDGELLLNCSCRVECSRRMRGMGTRGPPAVDRWIMLLLGLAMASG